MHPYRSILWGLGAALIGVIVCLLGTTPFYLHGTGYFQNVWFGWLYQLIVGGLMLGVGITTLDISTHGTKLFSKELYHWLGSGLIIFGLIVLANFNRYNEVFLMFGSWPIYVIGGWVVFNGLLSAAHHLTVFEPAPKSALITD